MTTTELTRETDTLSRIDRALERAGHMLDQAAGSCSRLSATADTRQGKLQALDVENEIADAAQMLEEIRALIAESIQQG